MSSWIFEHPAPPADRRARYADGEHAFGDLRVPRGDGPHPVVVVLHGGFWRARFDLEHLGHACADLARRGFATWSLEYRRVGHAGGGYPGTLDDVRRGADHLTVLAREHRLDMERVVALGHSAGGQLALWLAAQGAPARRLPLRAVIALAAVSDLADAAARGVNHGIVPAFMGGTPESAPERYAAASPAELVPIGVRQILIHGEDDARVPFAFSRDHVARARGAGDDAELVALPGDGHFGLVDPRSDEWPAVVAAVQRAIGRRSVEAA